MIGLEYTVINSNISYTNLASKLGVSKQSVSTWVSKKRRIPKKYLPMLSEILQIPKEYLQKELTEDEQIEIKYIRLNNEIKGNKSNNNGEIYESSLDRIMINILEKQKEYEKKKRQSIINHINSRIELLNREIDELNTQKSKLMISE